MSGTIHRLACVETDASLIGEGTCIWAFAHVMRDVTIGCDCNIGDHVFIENGVAIGRGVTIKNGVMVWRGVHLADFTFVGPGVVFTNDRRPRSPRLPVLKAQGYSETDWLVETRVDEGASIGAGVVILPGVRIGSYAMVGAASLVTRDIPPFRLAVGSPARCIGWVDESGRRLLPAGDLWREPSSGRMYRIAGDRPERVS